MCTCVCNVSRLISSLMSCKIVRDASLSLSPLIRLEVPRVGARVGCQVLLVLRRVTIGGESALAVLGSARASVVGVRGGGGDQRGAVAGVAHLDLWKLGVIDPGSDTIPGLGVAGLEGVHGAQGVRGAAVLRGVWARAHRGHQVDREGEDVQREDERDRPLQHRRGVPMVVRHGAAEGYQQPHLY